MVGFIAALALLAAMGVLGVTLLRRAVDCLEPLEYTAYGIPLGAVIVSLAVVPLATLFGLSTVLVVVVAAISTTAAILLFPVSLSWTSFHTAGRSVCHSFAGLLPATVLYKARKASLWPAVVLSVFVLRWAFLYRGALVYKPDGLWAGHVNIWGDWALHLGDVTAFVYADNFPPKDPRFLGHPPAYHFLTSITAAAMVKLGLDPAPALSLQSFLFTVLLTLALYAFARRLTYDRGTAALTLVLFLLGGSLGWLIVAGDINRSQDLVGTLLQQPWDQGRQDAANFRWQNLFFGLILPQRGHLYGLPLALLVLTLLLMAARTGQHRLFLIAGVVAGLLPLAHTSTLVVLALITPFLVPLFPSRGWFLFFAVWIAVAAPQIYFQQGGERGETTAMRLQLGWVAGKDLWLWFWLKNLGWFLPLLFLVLADRQLLLGPERRLLWAFMPLFLIANLVVFRPWDWDNTKVFLYWFLAVSIFVAALLMKPGVSTGHRRSVSCLPPPW